MADSLMDKIRATLGGSVSAAALADAPAPVAAPAGGNDGGDQACDTVTMSIADRDKLVATAHAQGAADEQTRWGAVLTSEEAEGRMGLAVTMLNTTTNTAETIEANLKAAAKEAPAAEAASVAGPTHASHQAPAADPIAAATPLVETGGAAADADDIDAEKSWDAVISDMSPDFSATNGFGR